MKLKIDLIGEPKEGVSKTGKPWKIVSFQSDGEWYSGFTDDRSRFGQDWKVGMTVDVNVTEKQGKDGKVFKNISPITKVDRLEVRVEALEKRVAELSGAAPAVEDEPPLTDEDITAYENPTKSKEIG